MAASAVEKALGKRVAELRKAAKLTQADLAEKVGVGVETISRLERGASIPPLDRLDKVARVLSVGLKDLFEPTPASNALAALMDQLRPHTDADVELVSEVARTILGHASRNKGRKRRTEPK